MAILIRWAALAATALLFTGPAHANEKRYGLTSFESIEVQADFAVEVTTRSPIGAVATGSQDALDRVRIEARDGRLVISERRFAGDEKRRAPRSGVTIQVNVANLRAASLASAGSLRIDRLKGNSVDISLRGPGQLTVGQIVTDRLSVAMVGNGTMTLGGTAKRTQLRASGAGMIDAGSLSITDLASDSEGAGDHLFRAIRTAAITTRGIGKTVVRGRPSCTVRNLGSGSVTCGSGK